MWGEWCLQCWLCDLDYTKTIGEPNDKHFLVHAGFVMSLVDRAHMVMRENCV